MAMLYAADEKGNKNAARAAKIAAYTLKNENLPESSTKVEPKVKVKNESKVEAKTEPEAQNGDSLVMPTGIRLLGNDLSGAQIENLYNSKNNSTIKSSKDVYTTKKTNYKNTYKPQNVDVYGLSGNDLQIPFEDRSILADYKKQYEQAEEELDYMKMNRIHKKAAKFRQQYYDYKDDYDYTHGGLYDIYTNFDDSDASYDENGHYEYVYRFDDKSLDSFFEKADDFISETITASDVVKDIVWEVVEDELKKNLSKSVVTKYNIISAILTAGEFAHVYLQCVEAISFITAKKYCEELTKKYANKNVDYYVYLLNGGSTTEFKVRVVDKSTGESLLENSFDIHQERSYNSCIESADKNGNLASVNRRHWKYTYLK